MFPGSCKQSLTLSILSIFEPFLFKYRISKLLNDYLTAKATYGYCQLTGELAVNLLQNVTANAFAYAC